MSNLDPLETDLSRRLHWTRLLAPAAGLMLTLAFAAAQGTDEPATDAFNPFDRNPAAVTAGDKLFHERCAVCHGQGGQGAMASNLVQTRTVRGGTPASVFQIIRRGIPGTDMPPQPDLEADRIWEMVAYLRAQALPGRQPPLEGDVQAGRAVFEDAGCIGCHIVNGSGGFLGPPLDAISRQKTSAAIRQDVVEPNLELADGFETVTAVTEDGQRVEGVLKYEDTFTVLVLTTEGNVRSLQRPRLQDLEMPKRSHMPSDFGEKLSATELTNLLAYLDRQRDPHFRVTRGFGNY